MWKIGYLLLCEDIFDDGKQKIIRKPLSSLDPLSIPGNFSFNIAFSLYNENLDEARDVNELQVKFFDPEGAVIQNTGSLKFKFDDGNIPEDAVFEIGEASMGFNNVELMKSGIYQVELKVNDTVKVVDVPVAKKLEKDRR